MKKTRITETALDPSCPVAKRLRTVECASKGAAHKLTQEWLKEWRAEKTTHTAKPTAVGYALFANGKHVRSIIVDDTFEYAGVARDEERVHEEPEPAGNEPAEGHHGYHVKVSGTVYIMADTAEQAVARVRQGLRKQQKVTFTKMEVEWVGAELEA